MTRKKQVVEEEPKAEVEAVEAAPAVEEQPEPEPQPAPAPEPEPPANVGIPDAPRLFVQIARKVDGEWSTVGYATFPTQPDGRDIIWAPATFTHEEALRVAEDYKRVGYFVRAAAVEA